MTLVDGEVYEAETPTGLLEELPLTWSVVLEAVVESDDHLLTRSDLGADPQYEGATRDIGSRGGDEEARDTLVRHNITDPGVVGTALDADDREWVYLARGGQFCAVRLAPDMHAPALGGGARGPLDGGD